MEDLSRDLQDTPFATQPPGSESSDRFQDALTLDSHDLIMGLLARHRSLRYWLDRCLPPVCLVCGDPLERREARVCGLCWSRAPRQRAPRCGRCGISLRDIGAERRGCTCLECEDWLPYLKIARAPFVMAGVAAQLVHQLKYGGWRDTAEEMGEAMAAERLPAAVAAEIAAVVPVPLSRTRLRERGFNQAALLAAIVSRSRGWPLATHLLIRRRHTARQASLAGGARSANVAMAFAVADAEPDIRDSHLLLVDDVLTTAATAQDCVRALCSAGARAVSVLTFARARPELPRAEV